MPRRQPHPRTFELKRAQYRTQRLQKRVKAVKEAFKTNPAAADEEYQKLMAELRTYRLEEDKFFIEQEILDHQFKQAGLPPRYAPPRERVPRGDY